jgi:hypothetical protein
VQSKLDGTHFFPFYQRSKLFIFNFFQSSKQDQTKFPKMNESIGTIY